MAKTVWAGRRLDGEICALWLKHPSPSTPTKFCELIVEELAADHPDVLAFCGPPRSIPVSDLPALLNAMALAVGGAVHPTLVEALATRRRLH